MTPDEISKLAFLLYPHIATSKTDVTTTESLAERIKAVHKGLLPEDEFAATVCWLGNCAGIHRIDQTPIPSCAIGEPMRAPDFMAFPIVEGRPLPVLIEVKSRPEDHLDWTENYLSSLKRFAEYVNLPLLLAWKCGGLWTLVDHQHFKRNVVAYRLTLERALMEDLYCVLFRNLRIRMNPELEFIIDMEILEEVAGGTETLLPEGTFRMKIVGAGYYSHGVEIKDYQPQHSALFFAAPDDAEVRRTGKQTCQHIFRPLPDESFTLSNVLVAGLFLRDAGESVNWHDVLARGDFPSSGREFRNSLEAAIEKGFVRYVFDIVPNTWPAFLPPHSEMKDF